MLQPLRVSDNRRYLVRADGSPFFYLGDTAWEMLHRCDRGEIDHYLINRAGKGFTVIQTVILPEINGIRTPNRYGDLPLNDEDPTRPNELYFQHVDYAVNSAAEFGLYVALLPTWGAHTIKEDHPLFPNTPLFTPDNARSYGRFLGDRYRDKANIIWILGGDRPPVAAMEIWSAMVRGIKEGEGAGGRHLMSYHPMGEQRSSTWFHQAEWLDFNMLQSGHARRANPNYLMIEQDYVLKPPKPCMDGEPCYEDLPVGFTAANQSVFGEHDVRQAAYWAVFAGAHGHTYGCNSIWQMYTKDVAPLVDAHRPWKEALHLPGSFQMRHLRRLIESRPFLSRIPDQSLLTNPPRPMSDHCRATRDGTQRSADATYIMAYTPYVSLIGVRTSAIAGKRLRPWWYDPRTGAAYPQPEVDNSGEYHAPWHTQPWLTQGPDWVLVVDDADKGYAPPGEARST